MRKSFFNLSTLLLLAFVVPHTGRAQQATREGPQLFPITHGSPDDGLPQKLRARGTITRIDYAPPRCGELIFPATLEIKPDGRMSGYNHPFLYLVVPCLYQPQGAEKFLNQQVEITVRKQGADRQPCFYDVGSSRIDSRGVPFYCADREELLRAVVREPVPARKEPLEFAGTLEEGFTYRALVIFDQEQQWRPVAPLKLPSHHAGRVEWLNLKDFPELTKRPPNIRLKQFVFKVSGKKIVKVSGQ
ncbi:MAG TPA: hypothetical protein VEQ40_03565, partial [Pyrinomonadaceae bacterium]|nr:hypothetical protein [Pyrinomonadaceae bacterium]